MARKKTRFITPEDQPLLDISSLIDVCFLLLIYFIVTSQIVPQEKDLPMTMPGGISDNDIGCPMLIAVRQNGDIVVNKNELMDTGTVGRKRSLPNLSTRLHELRAMMLTSGKEGSLQLYVEGDCSQQVVIDVLNCIRGANISNITFTDIE